MSDTPREGSEMEPDAIEGSELKIRQPNWISHTEEGDKYTLHFPALPPEDLTGEAWLLKAHLVGKCAECGHEIKTEVRLRPMDLSLEGVKVEEPHV